MALVSLKEPWGSTGNHAVVIFLPFAFVAWLAWKPSWVAAFLTLLLHISLGALAALAFEEHGANSIAASAFLVLTLTALLWQGRAVWRVLDLSPLILRLRHLMKMAARDPRRSVRFSVGAGRRQRRIRAIRIPHYWLVQIQGAERWMGLVPLKDLEMELGFGGEISFRFKRPGYVTPLAGECVIDLENLTRFDKLAREAS